MPVIGIVGLGLVGCGWGIVFARAGHRALVHDANPAALERGLAAIEASLRDLADAGLITEDPAVVRGRIHAVGTLAEAVADAAYVQENVAESLAAKLDVFAAMDAAAPRAAILASSTSSIPASAFTADLAGRERCLVVHPALPVHLIPVVELAPAPWTSPAVVEATRALQASVGQSPVVLRREIQGFVFNRLQAALMCEAVNLWEAGIASADDIDRTVRDGLGLRWSFMGPLETHDMAAPGGIADAGSRYGPAFNAIVAGQVQVPWTPDLLARLDAERRTIQPREALPARARWRDRRLMGLLRHKREAAAREAE